MRKIYMITIQHGESAYYKWTTNKPISDYVNGFLRGALNISEFEVTDEELKVLEKFRVI